jgi:hypothetical protein
MEFTRQLLLARIKEFAEARCILCETRESIQFIDTMSVEEVEGRFYVKLEEYVGLKEFNICFGRIELVEDIIEGEKLVWYDHHTLYRRVLHMTDAAIDVDSVMTELIQEASSHGCWVI